MKVFNIGEQVWAKKDLKVFKFRNGDEIPIVQNAVEWRHAESAAMCIDPNTGYCLYNWYAVNDPRGLAPKGWRIATNADFEELLKSVRLDTNFVSNLFRTMKGMRCGFSGDYVFGNQVGYWWSFAPDNTSYGWFRYHAASDDKVNRDVYPPRYGLSVRCLLDT